MREPIILIVEDEPRVCDLLAAILSEAGIRHILKAPNGETALNLMKNAPPDLVLTDLNMPGMSGLELIVTLRRLHPKLPIVVTSGSITPELTEGSNAWGVDRWLRKPFKIDEIRQIAWDLMHKPESTTDAQGPRQ